MRLTFTKVAYTILLSYLLVSCYTGYILIRNRIWREKFQEEKIKQIAALAEDDTDWNPWGEEFENEQVLISHHEPPKILWNLETQKSEGRQLNKGANNTSIFNVEIWGKAAIGLYLWQHILGGPLEEKLGGVWSFGAKTVNNIRFSFRTGPGVVPEKVPKDAENVVLVLNGREPNKIEFAKQWLDSVSRLPRLQNLAVVLLGNEQCNNEWIKSYMHYNGGPVKIVFLVYDSPDIDNVSFYQWPLGVATYRDFPLVDSSQLPVHLYRKYSCNFLGTVYKNSSRETLLKILQSSAYKDLCYTKPRMSWLPSETKDTRQDYLQALSQSDLTLNPVGQNSECYRVYEAMAYGSIPVIEDVMTPGHCGKAGSSSQYPLRLLKELEAPFIYIKDWAELQNILERERSLRHSDKVKRRRNMLLWYESFKSKMRDKFVRVINKMFFGVSR